MSWTHLPGCHAPEPELPPELAGRSPGAIAAALATRQLIGELAGDMGMSLGLPADTGPVAADGESAGARPAT